jgi:PLD-like domain
MKLLPPLTNSWRGSFERLLRGVESDLVLCSPFVSRNGMVFVNHLLPSRFRQSGKLTVVTNLNVDNVLSQSTDPVAVRDLTRLASSSLAFHLPGLHAKVYVADSTHAIVTSGNLTGGGLNRNHEYGVELTDGPVVARIRSDLTALAGLGTVVPAPTLAHYCRIVQSHAAELSRIREQQKEQVRADLRRELASVGDELLRLRLSAGPVHTVFARTILYVLQTNGPLPTVRIHEFIQSIHPDLCDMSVDRVIDGKRFGKKWKHAVRTAQQQLKKQGKVTYGNDLWRLAVDQPR